MPTFQSFEDIDAWQKARELVQRIYAVSGKGPFAKDFALRDQARRAAVSIMANIAEGFGRGGNREFLQFASMAKGSASEVNSHLYVALDQGYVDRDGFDELSALVCDVANLLGGLIRYLKRTSSKGSKFK